MYGPNTNTYESVDSATTPCFTVAYDANGNTLSDPSGKSYTWDFENRMVSAVVPGTGTVTFKYNPFGRRIEKSSALGTTIYLYDGLNPMEEIDASGNLVARYATTRALDEEFAELRSGNTSYYEQEGIGSVTSLSSSSGYLANTYSYDSFGKVTASSGTLINPFGFTGRDFDQEIGFNYYRARYYDPSVGRFVSEDKIGFMGGINFYGYVENRPVLLTDPLGLAPQCPPVPNDPCHTYDKCGRNDLGAICRGFGNGGPNDCVRGCLQESFDCRTKSYNDPVWGRYGPVVHVRCFKKCGIPFPGNIFPNATGVDPAM